MLSVLLILICPAKDCNLSDSCPASVEMISRRLKGEVFELTKFSKPDIPNLSSQFRLLDFFFFWITNKINLLEFWILHTFTCKFLQLIWTQHIFGMSVQLLIQKKNWRPFCDCPPGAMFIPTKSCKYRQSARSTQSFDPIGQYTN